MEKERVRQFVARFGFELKSVQNWDENVLEINSKNCDLGLKLKSYIWVLNQATRYNLKNVSVNKILNYSSRIIKRCRKNQKKHNSDTLNRKRTSPEMFFETACLQTS